MLQNKALVKTWLLCCFCVATCTACSLITLPTAQQRGPASHLQSVAIYPAHKLKDYPGEVWQLTVPISTTGYAGTFIEYKSPDEAGYVTLADDIFPLDIYLANLPDRELPKVFLGRSPQSGCPLEWLHQARLFKALCDGSEFTIEGAYQSGPSPRNLDELPVSIHDGMIWITNTVTLGAPVVGSESK